MTCAVRRLTECKRLHVTAPDHQLMNAHALQFITDYFSNLEELTVTEVPTANFLGRYLHKI